MHLRLKEFRKRKKLTIEQVAAALGISDAQVSRIENGKSDTSLTRLQEFADLYEVDASDLIANGLIDVPLLKVTAKGFVQAGAWRESYELSADEWYEVLVPALPPEYRNAFGVKVIGDSMNLVYPGGTTLVCVPLGDYPHGLKDGDHVVVRRRNNIGEYETTVKELKMQNGHRWLWPRSNDPQHQQPLELNGTEHDPAHAGSPEIEIAAIVVQFVGSRIPAT